MPTKTVPKYPCQRCGKVDVAERMVYSTWSHSRYCGYDLNACAKRASTRRKKEMAA